jgi:hypothetical protein
MKTRLAGAGSGMKSGSAIGDPGDDGFVSRESLYFETGKGRSPLAEYDT